MTRIKKRGLEYFPMDADFTRQPAIRRIMKKEGEGAALVLIEVLCAIYSHEGYYVKADALFYEDVAAVCYERNETDVRRIIALAVDYGLFDATLYSEQGVLTSVEIQQQFLHCTRRRVNTHLHKEYMLVTDVDAPEVQPRRVRKSSVTTLVQKELPLATAACSDVCVTQTPQNVTSHPHSIAKQSKITPSIPLGQGEVVEDENIASPLMNEPIAGYASGGMGGVLPVECKQPTNAQQATGQVVNAQLANVQMANAQHINAQQVNGQQVNRQPVNAQQVITQEMIDSMQPPHDGVRRNLDGLKLSLLQHRISPAEQHAIIRKSNFGMIGHAVWKGISTLHSSGGKIKMPGRYLLSLR